MTSGIQEKKTQKTPRNVRIRNTIWETAKKKAERIGVSMTFVIERSLIEFVKSPKIIIEDMERVEVPEKMQKTLSDIARALRTS